MPSAKSSPATSRPTAAPRSGVLPPMRAPLHLRRNMADTLVKVLWLIAAAFVARYGNRVLDIIEPRVLKAAGVATRAALPLLRRLALRAMRPALAVAMTFVFWELGGLTGVVGAVAGIASVELAVWTHRRFSWLTLDLSDVLKLTIGGALVHDGARGLMAHDERWFFALGLSLGSVGLLAEAWTLFLKWGRRQRAI